ncbi:hypothetical protein [Sutcliffiella rhizosphaerae]|uniref:Integral membrane protein n=1 Tax=Sutcliffiella rhizosphaerae TaxID=2880967 RepID=A0ABM8YM85_9BACI|nr:hypothetical protein [Sutcliffiella rhizosphaerae]CAG9621118.1 hypothetical protein BACCIP111883_01890 [Sutcliffiella rhizosphaerae]
MNLVDVATILVAMVFVIVVVFQVLLSLGFPLGEMAMGGYHKILPKGLRVVSAGNALILILMTIIFLQHTFQVSTALAFLPTSVLVWIITVFLAINTLANFFSTSRKEKVFMTPLSGVAMLLCLFISLS